MMGAVLVLVGLVMGSVRPTKMKAQAAVCLSRLHQNDLMVRLYCADSKDVWPYMLRSGFRDPYKNRELDMSTPYGLSSYTWVGSLWHQPMLSGSYAGNPFDPVLYCPASPKRERMLAEGADPMRAWATGISMSMAMYLDPISLDPANAKWEKQYFRPTKTTDVAFPSQKAALYCVLPWHDPAVRIASPFLNATPPFSLTSTACDGSGALRQGRTLSEGVVFPFPDLLGRPVRDGWLDSLKFTRHGIHGRDW